MFSKLQTYPPAPRPTASHRKSLRPIISPATPVESTLPRPLASVHSKPLTATRFPLESTLTKKPGGRGRLSLTRHATKRVCPEEHRDEGPLYVPTGDLSPQKHRDEGPLYVPTGDLSPQKHRDEGPLYVPTGDLSPQKHRDEGPLYVPPAIYLPKNIATRDLSTSPRRFISPKTSRRGTSLRPHRRFISRKASRRGLSSALPGDSVPSDHRVEGQCSLFTSSPTETNSAPPAAYPRSPPTPETSRAAAPALSPSRLSIC